MDKIEVKFGHRIKELRLKQNISQEEFTVPGHGWILVEQA